MVTEKGELTEKGEKIFLGSIMIASLVIFCIIVAWQFWPLNSVETYKSVELPIKLDFEDGKLPAYVVADCTNESNLIEVVADNAKTGIHSCHMTQKVDGRTALRFDILPQTSVFLDIPFKIENEPFDGLDCRLADVVGTKGTWFVAMNVGIRYINNSWQVEIITYFGNENKTEFKAFPIDLTKNEYHSIQIGVVKGKNGGFYLYDNYNLTYSRLMDTSDIPDLTHILVGWEEGDAGIEGYFDDIVCAKEPISPLGGGNASKSVSFVMPEAPRLVEDGQLMAIVSLKANLTKEIYGYSALWINKKLVSNL